MLFYAVLSPDEVPSPTVSNAVGRADFSLDRTTLKLTWKVAYRDLTSELVGAAIHGPQRAGAIAGPILDLLPKGANTASPLEGSVVLTEGQLQYLLQRHLYLNLRTAKFKEGELRGQIDRVPLSQMTDTGFLGNP